MSDSPVPTAKQKESAKILFDSGVLTQEEFRNFTLYGNFKGISPNQIESPLAPVNDSGIYAWDEKLTPEQEAQVNLTTTIYDVSADLDAYGCTCGAHYTPNPHSPSCPMNIHNKPELVTHSGSRGGGKTEAQRLAAIRALAANYISDAHGCESIFQEIVDIVDGKR